MCSMTLMINRRREGKMNIRAKLTKEKSVLAGTLKVQNKAP